MSAYSSATDKQLGYIDFLARKAGFGSRDAAIKAIIGKHPIGGLKQHHASRVIEELQQKAGLTYTGRSKSRYR